MRGKRRFEVVGEPWLDDTKSFYLARVDIIDQRLEEELSGELQQQAKHLSARIPPLVQEWVQWVLKSKKATPAGMNQRLEDIGPMPPSHSLKELAIWVSALVNPIPTLGVCLEIRPAMLSCRNDHDRVVLASTALQSSIDHLSGKRRLF
jgi:hypothetical protein